MIEGLTMERGSQKRTMSSERWERGFVGKYIKAKEKARRWTETHFRMHNRVFTAGAGQ